LQETHKKSKKPKGICGEFSPIALYHKAATKLTAIPHSSLGSASGSTTYSPNRNSFSVLSEDRKDNSETTAALPIDDVDLMIQAGDRVTSRASSNVSNDESEQKEGEAAVGSDI